MASLVVTEINEETATKLTGQEDLLTGGESTSAVSSAAAVLTPELASNTESENTALKGEWVRSFVDFCLNRT